MAPIASRTLTTMLLAFYLLLPSAATRAQDSPPAADASTPKPASACVNETVRTETQPAGTESKPKPDSESQAPDNSGKVKSKGKTVKRGNAPCLSWIDSEQPLRAAILCVHGLGLHNGTYDAFGKRMSKLGYAVYAIDVRGFGSWMAAQGRERVDFDGCMEDVRSTLKVVHRAHPGLPVFIMGESMGGAIALRACALYPELVDGLISSVPAGDRFKQGQAKLSVAFHLLADPNQPFDIGTSVIKQATVKPELRDSWGNNPLSRLKVSANELIQFQNFMNQNHKWAVQIKDRPVLFVQGCDDKLVRPAGTVELFNRLATRDRQIELIPKAEHLIFEEAQFTDQEVEIVNKWLSSHLSSTKSAPSETGSGVEKKIGANESASQGSR